MERAEVERRQTEACIGALSAVRFIRGRYASGATAGERIQELCEELARTDEVLGILHADLCTNIADAISKTYLSRPLTKAGRPAP